MATQVEEIKWLPSNTDRRFLVDGFGFKTPDCQTYLLTHFHSDHTIGLTKGFSYGLVWTSEITARLLIHDMGLPERCVRVLPMHKPTLMHGCRITLLDANHCPGAVMVLVEVLQDKNGKPLQQPQHILHMGDCRWEDRLADQLPKGLQVHTIFMDTTYAVPRYTFPPQAVVLNALGDEVASLLQTQPNTLLVVAAYHIGKEKVYLGLARRLGIKVWCSQAKRRVLCMLGLPAEDMDVLTDQPHKARLHVTGWGMRPEQLQQKFLGGNGGSGDQGGQASDVNWSGAGTLEMGAGDGSLSDHPHPMHQPQQQTQQAQQGVLVKEEEDGVDESLLGPGGEGEGPPPDSYEGREEEEGAAAACKGRWQYVIGIKATGWSFRKNGKLVSKWVSGPVTILGAPYSEHSSFNELCSCVKLLRPSKLVPTVNASTPAASRALVERFVPYMDLSRQRGRLDMYLQRGLPSSTSAVCTAGGGGLSLARSSSMSEPSSALLTSTLRKAGPSVIRSAAAEVVVMDLTADVDGVDNHAPATCVANEAVHMAVHGSRCGLGAGVNGLQNDEIKQAVVEGSQLQEVVVMEEEEEGEEDEDKVVQQHMFGEGNGCMCYAKPMFAKESTDVVGDIQLQEHQQRVNEPSQLDHQQHQQTGIGLLQPPQPMQQQRQTQTGVLQQQEQHAALSLPPQGALPAAALDQPMGSVDMMRGTDRGVVDCDVSVEEVDVREQQRIWELIQRDKDKASRQHNSNNNNHHLGNRHGNGQAGSVDNDGGDGRSRRGGRAQHSQGDDGGGGQGSGASQRGNSSAGVGGVKRRSSTGGTGGRGSAGGGGAGGARGGRGSAGGGGAGGSSAKKVRTGSMSAPDVVVLDDDGGGMAPVTPGGGVSRGDGGSGGGVSQGGEGEGVVRKERVQRTLHSFFSKGGG